MARHLERRAGRRTPAARALAGVAAIIGSVGVWGVQEASAATGIVAAYEMNEGSGASVMVDAGPNHLNGTIGADVVTGATYNGATGYRWPFTLPTEPPQKPGRNVNVPDDDLLDPDGGDYAIELRYRTTHSFGNVIQKGQNNVTGGYWKIEQPNGNMRCQFKDRNGRARAVLSPVKTNDGQWHVIRCERTPTVIRLLVDGVEVVRNNASAVGVINNIKPLSIGGKSECNQITVTCDYFTGDIDYVHIEKAGGTGDPPPPPPPPPPSGDVSFVAASTLSRTSSTARVTLPAVQAGDTIVLAVVTGATATIDAPSGSGWQSTGAASGSKGSLRVWWKTATASDSGARVDIPMSRSAKVNATALAYRGASTSSPIAAFAAGVATNSSTTRVTPSTATNSGTTAISYWMHRDSSSTSLTPPAGVVSRAAATQTGGGHPTVLAADSGNATIGSTYGGLSATAQAASTYGITFTLILR